MKVSAFAAALACSALAAGWAGATYAQVGASNLEAAIDNSEIKVTIDNFVRAATDIEMGKYLPVAGGVNRLFSSREPTSVNRQPTIRMNRDTLYSMAVIDISKGATLTLPDTGDRYISAMIVNQDHYINKIFVKGGTYKLDVATFDTPYVVLVVRILVNASDPKDVETVHALQDQIAIKVNSSEPFIVPNYNRASFDAVLKASLELARSSPDSRQTFGSKKEVDPVRHFLGTAVGWGGLPEYEAFYLNVEPGLPVGAYKIEVPAKVPVSGFWSVSVYNAKGFFEPNSLNAYNVNSVSGVRNGDGGMTIHLGACDDKRVNCLPIVDGWNYAVRLYRPGKEILDGTWTFPAAQRMQ